MVTVNRYKNFKESSLIWSKIKIFFLGYKKILEIMTAKDGERFAGQEVTVPGFDTVPLPEQFGFARDYKLLPVFVMPEHAEEVSKVFRFLSETVKVSNSKF